MIPERMDYDAESLSAKTPNEQGRPEPKKQLGNCELPIWQVMPEIVGTLRENNRLILVSETGSGKTTQLPQALYEAGFADQGTIFVVENRVAVAVETCNRVAKEMDVEVGREVGYLTGPEKRSGRNSKIVFLTAGVFKNIVRSDPKLEQASVVLFDEFDERYLLEDIGAALAEKAQDQGSNVKFALMSATLNAEKFSKHFGDGPVIEAKGRPYPVAVTYAQELIPLYRMPEEAAAVAARVHKTKPEDGDVLIFMPGKAEITATMDHLAKARLSGATIVPFHSELSPAERRLVFEPTQGRKIIIATNIAERGLTFDRVRYGIVSGLARMPVYDAAADTTKLAIVPIAQDALVQQQGRMGRTGPGECEFLITEDEFNRRPRSTQPEIMRTSLRDVVLQIKAMGYSREDEPLHFIDNPEKQNWKTAKDQLRLLGALDPSDESKLSEFGQQLAELGVDPREGAMVLHGCELGCGFEMACIAALRGSRRLLYRPQSEADQANYAHQRFAVSTESDIFNMLTVIGQATQAEQAGRLSEWCRENYVSWQALREYKQNLSQLLSTLKRQGFDTNNQPATNTLMRQAIARGFADKVYQATGDGWYEHIETGERVQLGRDSRVKGDLIAAHEVISIQTRRGDLPLITTATKVEREWVLPSVIDRAARSDEAKTYIGNDPEGLNRLKDRLTARLQELPGVPNQRELARLTTETLDSMTS